MFWLCMMNGAAGHTYGANGIWQCNRKGQPHGASPTPRQRRLRQHLLGRGHAPRRRPSDRRRQALAGDAPLVDLRASLHVGGLGRCCGSGTGAVPVTAPSGNVVRPAPSAARMGRACFTCLSIGRLSSDSSSPAELTPSRTSIRSTAPCRPAATWWPTAKGRPAWRHPGTATIGWYF